MRRRSILHGLAALTVTQSVAQETPRLGEPAPLPKRDWRSKPFKVAVALGESTTAGGTATHENHRALTVLHSPAVQTVGRGGAESAAGFSAVS